MNLAGSPSSSRSSVTATPSPIAASSGDNVSTITVTVRDAFGNAVSGALVSLSASGANNNLTPSGTTGSDGVMTGTLSSTGAGTKTITATVGGVTINDKPSVTVEPAAAATLVFTVQPSRVVVGSAISPPVVVTAFDPFKNIATGLGDVTMTIADDGSFFGGATLGGTPTVAAVSGVATFSNLTIDSLGLLYTLRASSGGLEVTSQSFNVVTIL